MSSSLTINQWIPAAHRGDAVGDNARPCAICAAGDTRPRSRDVDRRQHGRRGGAVERLGGNRRRCHDLTTRAVADVRAVRCPPGACCNITTSRRRIFRAHDTGIARMCQVGRNNSHARRSHRPDWATEFNRSELEAMGFPKTDVLRSLSTRIACATRRPCRRSTRCSRSRS